MKIKSAEFIRGIVEEKDYPKDKMPQIAVAGRSNVGKSTLLNFLLERKNLVKTSARPGKTRELNFFSINKAFYFVDIPGFGYAKASKEKRHLLETTVETYFKRSPQIHGVLYLIDIRMQDSPVDRAALDWLSKFDFPILIVATKADKFTSAQAKKAVEDLKARYDFPAKPCLTSASEKIGREEVWEQIDILLYGEKPEIRFEVAPK